MRAANGLEWQTFGWFGARRPAVTQTGRLYASVLILRSFADGPMHEHGAVQKRFQLRAGELDH
ncbi:MAG: hypothetical protein B7Z29_13065 [Hyphomicrobium sp. 12-62-95]|nr:MAG: hypothetical protein B7Z29_13065 [Hyphomicrobium sp. 12-62-95]